MSSLPRLSFSKERRRLLKRVNLMNSTILRNSLLVLIKTIAGNESSFAIIIDKVQACVAMTPMYRNSSAEDFDFRTQEMPKQQDPCTRKITDCITNTISDSILECVGAMIRFYICFFN